MTVLKIPYQFHDALLEDFQVGPHRELKLRIALYSVFYPGSPVVSVHFEEITNFEKVEAYFSKIKKSDPEEGFILIRALEYDVKYHSTESKRHFYLKLDWEGSLKIRCGKFTINTHEGPPVLQ